MILARKSPTVSGLPWRGSDAAGFTVLEVLLVVALIAALSGLMLGAGRYARNSARASRASAELSALAAALESYRLAYGDYPRTNQSARLLQSLLGRRGPEGDSIMGPSIIEAVRFTVGGGDPVLSEACELVDPWGAPYGYAYKSGLPWTNPGYVLYSSGPDGLVSAALLTGGFPAYTSPGNDDNLWANPP
jgi:type II secretory pathway pseudopilin PulG